MGIQEQFYEIVSGRKKSVKAFMIRSILNGLELPYAAVVACRNKLYEQKFLHSKKYSVPIISVGNLTLGGTGKSPMTAWLCRFFDEHQRHVGLVSRGYKKTSQKGNDEWLEMSYRFPKIPHFQHPKRVQAIDAMLETELADVIVLDDAFQHRQVHRNLDIVLLDATAPFGFNHVFPRGTLREPLGSLRRADIVLLTRSDGVNDAQRQAIRDRVFEYNPNIIWGETVHAPTKLVSMGTFEEEPIDFLHGKSAFAFCGIGNPTAFFSTVERCGARIAELLSFPDHHRYTQQNRDDIIQRVQELGTDLILCTMKDLVKLAEFDFSGLRAVLIDIQFTAGESAVCERIREVCRIQETKPKQFYPKG